MSNDNDNTNETPDEGLGGDDITELIDKLKEVKRAASPSIGTRRLHAFIESGKTWRYWDCGTATQAMRTRTSITGAIRDRYVTDDIKVSVQNRYVIVYRPKDMKADERAALKDAGFNLRGFGGV